MAQLVEYELERLKRIEENKKRLAALGIDKTVAEIERAQHEERRRRQAARRTYSQRPQPRSEPAELRRSGR